MIEKIEIVFRPVTEYITNSLYISVIVALLERKNDKLEKQSHVMQRLNHDLINIS